MRGTPTQLLCSLWYNYASKWTELRHVMVTEACLPLPPVMVSWCPLGPGTQPTKRHAAWNGNDLWRASRSLHPCLGEQQLLVGRLSNIQARRWGWGQKMHYYVARRWGCGSHQR